METGTTWTEETMGDLTGRTAVVTGASSGIGLQTARHLAGHGAEVMLACRDEDRGRQAAQQITATSESQARAEVLDLADLASVGRFADRLLQR